MIQLLGINKTFNAGKPSEFKALKGIDLDIALNEVSVIRGPSGSGKTTLLSILGCMSRPTSGRIWLKEREITSLPERFASETRRKTFGFIFQNYNLIKGINVLENTMFPAYPTGTKYRMIRKRAVALLERLEIRPKTREKVENLSGGEQQRTGIARAIVTDPTLLLCDEPTGDLDRKSGDEILDLLQAPNKEQGKTIIMVTHDIHAAARATRTLYLNKGKLSSTPID